MKYIYRKLLYSIVIIWPTSISVIMYYSFLYHVHLFSFLVGSLSLSESQKHWIEILMKIDLLIASHVMDTSMKFLKKIY